MTNSTKVLTAISCGATLLFLAGCGGSAHSPAETYVLVASNIKLPYWQAAAAGVKQAATEMQVKFDVAGSEKFDPQGERAEFQRILSRSPKPTGILVSSADPELLKGDIDAAIAQGVPVIAIDSDAPASKRLMFIGTDNYKAGVMAAQVAVKQMNGKGTVAVFTIPSQTNLAQRLQGYKDVFAAHPQIKIVQTIDVKGDPGVAFDAAKEILSSGKPQPDALICLEAIACSDVAEVLSRNQITGKTVIAFDTDQDTLDWIRKGVITATVGQKPYTMAYFGVKMLDMLEHQKLPNLQANFAQDANSPIPSFIDTGAALIDKSNVDQFQPLGPPAGAKK